MFETILKSILGTVLVSFGIGLPMLLSGGRALACGREGQAVTCRVNQMGGGTLWRSGTQIIDSEVYSHIRQAKIATVNAQLTQRATSTIGTPEDVVKDVQLNRLVLVSATGQYPIQLSSGEGTDLPANIANQINQLVKDPKAPAISVEVGAGPLLPRFLGGGALLIGAIVLVDTLPKGRMKRR
ncbi:MAG: hypothetical protein RLZZ511_1647 [Cyanobacteriota bacterium]|jgi:hypothetical protein